MVVNPDKFQILLINKRKRHHTNEVLQTKEQSKKTVPSLELLSIEIDDKLSFNLHNSKICIYAANKSNAITCSRNLMTFNIKEALINTYFMSNFHYSPLVCMLSSLHRIEKLHKEL